MTPTNIRSLLLRDEGKVNYAYQDHLGYWTIGVGRLIDQRKGGGLSDEEVNYLLNNDIKRVEDELDKRLPWSKLLNDARRGVLISMAFQMGVAGLMGFRTTLSLVERGEYDAAAQQMLKSKWATQTPQRAQRLARQMRSGEWQ